MLLGETSLPRTADFDVRILGVPVPAGIRPEAIPEDGMVLEEEETLAAVHTDVISAFVDRRDERLDVALYVPPNSLRPDQLALHLDVVVNKILFLSGHLILHAGAVDHGERVDIFAGDAGAGKSTAVLTAGRAGAIVLGDDRLLLRRGPDGVFFVSGCNELGRVTARTESHLFDEPLPMEPRDINGRMKKEFPMADYVAALPHRDHRPHRLFFPRVGGRLAATPVSHQAALVLLLKGLRRQHRFVGPSDQSRLLGYLSDFLASIRAYLLDLGTEIPRPEAMRELLATLD